MFVSSYLKITSINVWWNHSIIIISLAFLSQNRLHKPPFSLFRKGSKHPSMKILWNNFIKKMIEMDCMYVLELAKSYKLKKAHAKLTLLVWPYLFGTSILRTYLLCRLKKCKIRRAKYLFGMHQKWHVRGHTLITLAHKGT